MNLAQTLTPDGNTQQLYLHNTDTGRMEILQNDSHVWLLLDGVVQSAIERTPPYRPILPHSLVMLLPLIHDKVPKRVLELGGGGLSCQRYLRHTQPSIEFTSVEANNTVIQAVTQYFPASEQLNVVHGDGFDAIAKQAASGQTVDWIMLDLSHDAELPLDDEHPALLNHIVQALAWDGWLIVNCMVQTEEARLALCATLTRVFSVRPHLFAVPDMLNHIILVQKTPKESNQFRFVQDLERHNLYI